MTNFVEEANYFDTGFDIINCNESESDLTEEDYWYSVEQLGEEQLGEEQLGEEQLGEEQLEEEQLEEELRDYEDSEEKEYYKYYYGDLKEENMSKKEHEFILYITENIIRECAGTELDYESVEKMTYDFYPRVCTLFKRDMLKNLNSTCY